MMQNATKMSQMMRNMLKTIICFKFYHYLKYFFVLQSSEKAKTVQNRTNRTLCPPGKFLTKFARLWDEIMKICNEQIHETGQI